MHSFFGFRNDQSRKGKKEKQHPEKDVGNNLQMQRQPKTTKGVARCTQCYCWCTQHHLKMSKMSLQCFVVRINLISERLPRIKLIREFSKDQLDSQETEFFLKSLLKRKAPPPQINLIHSFKIYMLIKLILNHHH